MIRKAISCGLLTLPNKKLDLVVHISSGDGGKATQTCSRRLESVRNGSAVLVLVGKVLRHVGENQIRDKSAGVFEGHRCSHIQLLAPMLGEHTLKSVFHWICV